MSLDLFSSLKWAVHADQSRLAAGVQSRLKQFVDIDSHRDAISIRDCRFGIKFGNASKKVRTIRGHGNESVGCIARDCRAFPRRGRFPDILAEYCGVALVDGKTFELVRHSTTPRSFTCHANAVEICRLEEVEFEGPPAKGIWQRLQRTLCGPRRWIVEGSRRLGTIELRYPVGSHRRRIYFETDQGVLPIQIMKPRRRDANYDLVIPEDTPQVSDPEIAVAHFLINIAFRICVLTLDYSSGDIG